MIYFFDVVQENRVRYETNKNRSELIKEERILKSSSVVHGSWTGSMPYKKHSWTKF